MLTCACWCLQIASAVFVRPPLATCGLTEQQAHARLTGDIDIFVSKFKPMKNTLSGRDEKTLMKIIVKVDTDEVSIAALSCAAVSSAAVVSPTTSMVSGACWPLQGQQLPTPPPSPPSPTPFT